MPSKRHQVLELLRQAGARGVTTAEFLQAGVGARYGARLLELRREGHVIDAQRVRDGSWRYTLRAPGPVAPTAGPSKRFLSPAPTADQRLFELAPTPANALCWDREAAA